MQLKHLFSMILLSAFVVTSFAFSKESSRIVVGSKAFTEGYILAELIAQKLEQNGFVVERRFGMGGTGILFEALDSDVIDIYPEYTGTIAESLLNPPHTQKDRASLYARVLDMGYDMTQSFGFNNTYALAMRQQESQNLQIFKISDLKKHPDLKVAFSHEFLNRSDGYPGLQLVYGLNFSQVMGIEHALAYQALETHQVALTDIYSTDAKVKSLQLRVLEDDLSFFPQYLPVALVKKQFKTRFPEAWSVIENLQDSISVSEMVDLNSKVDIDKIPYNVVVSRYLQPSAHIQQETLLTRVAQRTQEHILLVLIALLISLMIGFPLGVLATENIILERIILNVTSLLQTIPSLALLCFLIPLFGIGQISALVALILYGLLPIVVNTFTGLDSIDKKHHEVSCGLGLSWWETLFYVKIPMASPSILAGIKTSVIIGIGTATLSALIGAGGYGRPIMRGLALNDTNTILEGAIPAAGLALLANFVLEKINNKCIPDGLQK